MNLTAAVQRYLAATGEFGIPMPLAAFGLDRNATEAMLAAWEEDYQLHRHMELIPAGPQGPKTVKTATIEGREGPAGQERYFVGGIAYTGVVFRASIRSVMG